MAKYKTNAEVLRDVRAVFAENSELNEDMKLDHWLDVLAQLGVPGASETWFKRLDEEIDQERKNS